MESPRPGLLQSSGRLFNDNAISPYALPADDKEAQRLNEQHKVLTAAIGRLVLPDLSLKPKDRVLDAATGTGAWLLDCRTKAPAGVSFTGIDISPHLFPNSTQWPRYTTFERHSVLALPEEWTEAFALVNQRLLVLGLREEEWAMNLKELARVLRPGGWIQLCEPFLIPTRQPALAAPGLEIFSAIARSRGTDVDCAARLVERLRDTGFVNIASVVSALPLRVNAASSPSPELNYGKLYLATQTGLKDAALKAGVVASAEEYDQYLEELKAELQTTDAQFYFHWVWAQKPVNDSII